MITITDVVVSTSGVVTWVVCKLVGDRDGSIWALSELVSTTTMSGVVEIIEFVVFSGSLVVVVLVTVVVVVVDVVVVDVVVVVVVSGVLVTKVVVWGIFVVVVVVAGVVDKHVASLIASLSI